MWKYHSFKTPLLTINRNGNWKWSRYARKNSSTSKLLTVPKLLAPHKRGQSLGLVCKLSTIQLEYLVVLLKTANYWIPHIPFGKWFSNHRKVTVNGERETLSRTLIISQNALFKDHQLFSETRRYRVRWWLTLHHWFHDRVQSSDSEMFNSSRDNDRELEDIQKLISIRTTVNMCRSCK